MTGHAVRVDAGTDGMVYMRFGDSMVAVMWPDAITFGADLCASAGAASLMVGAPRETLLAALGAASVDARDLFRQILDDAAADDGT